jgi:hypothetical protein
MKEENTVEQQIIELLEGQNLIVLARIARHFELGAITQYEVYREEELLCDPIIWLEEDLEEATLEQWNNTRAPKTLLERSIEEGHEIRQFLEQWSMDESTTTEAEQ